jgi:aspartyl-tRNA(Asn)/glutamyl-tRNA(Gln) amidotransferase subunit B
MSNAYTTVIGLEVHVQLATQSKLFCRCSTRFGAEPNTQTCPVCIGMPGTLPVMNREAFYLALKTAVALNCKIPEFTKWDRKQYYYPDLPKGYQISQFDLPMSENGYLEISDPKGFFEPKRVGIIRAHLEEDAGKSVHDEIAAKGDSLIDLNRTGTPLLEIVSEPDLRSSLEARTFLNELKLLLTYLGVSDCNMQEGSLRVDANVNLHVPTQDGSVPTPIVEIKNMNSFRAVERALDYEAARQYQQWQETRQTLGNAPKQTRGWDEPAGVTRGQRSKEESSDYRYFPDPDLVPVTVTPDELEELRDSLGELPAALGRRLTEQHGLSQYDAEVLVNQGRPLVNYFLEVVELGTDSKAAANWVTQDVLRQLKDREETIEQFNVPPDALAELIAKIKSGDIPSTRGREVFEVMSGASQTVAQAMDALAIVEVDPSDLSSLCEKLLATNPKIVADVQNGKLKAIGSLIGQAKKQNPNVTPDQVRETCLQMILSQGQQ